MLARFGGISMEETHELLKERLKKIERIRALGIEPYGGAFSWNRSLREIRKEFKEGESVKVAGRITAFRVHGRSSFLDIRDASDHVQIYIKEGEVPPTAYALFEMLDIGDFIGVEGKLFKTKTGEASVKVASLTLLAKALRTLPEKWHGLKDVESRYRQRYLDLLVNPKVREIFIARSRLIREIRSFLDEKGYLEVETPMMHPVPGGAAGKPFKTRHDTLGMDLFLRVAPELYLKRLLVGGFDRVYEINRSFRNEGISTRHNPEFTMLEIYTAYSDVEEVMKLTEAIVRHAVRSLLGKESFTWQGLEIDMSRWDRVSFPDLMKDRFGISPRDEVAVWIEKLGEKGHRIQGKDLSRTKLIQIVGEIIEPDKHKHPVFVTDYFTELCPLAKRRSDDPSLSERFELFIGGMEVANGYSELNDPIEQERRLKEDEYAGAGAPGAIDRDYVRALEYGMPPAGGLGLGVDRLVMLLTDQSSIREVILFPQLKTAVPKSDSHPK